MNEKEMKLRARPVEPDTKVIVEMIVNFGDFTALYEKWSWDGITASSIICLEEDVKDRDQKGLIGFIFEKMQLPVDPKTTYSVNNGYVYVNFGFDAG